MKVKNSKERIKRLRRLSAMQEKFKKAIMSRCQEIKTSKVCVCHCVMCTTNKLVDNKLFQSIESLF